MKPKCHVCHRSVFDTKGEVWTFIASRFLWFGAGLYLMIHNHAPGWAWGMFCLLPANDWHCWNKTP